MAKIKLGGKEINTEDVAFVSKNSKGYVVTLKDGSTIDINDVEAHELCISYGICPPSPSPTSPPSSLEGP